MRFRRNVLFGLLLLGAAPCFADGGGPILLIINVPLFTVGQVWILAVEGYYLRRLFHMQSGGKAIGLALGLNFASTLLGAFLLPFLQALIGLVGLEGPLAGTKMGGLLLAAGTWIIGDPSPYPEVACTMAAIGFVATYFVTVWVEYRLVRRLLGEARAMPASVVLRQSFLWNGISYIGLILLFTVGVRFFG